MARPAALCRAAPDGAVKASQTRRPEAFAGIHVAVARAQRLPVCVRESGRLVPLPLAAAAARPPRGIGNVAAALDGAATRSFAGEAAAYLSAVETEFGVAVGRIALDAPAADTIWLPAPAGTRPGRGA